ncbi:hypothetical protein [Vulcanisaeta distributa]|uniref:hypothetical protein n=1 Tax=Vulcanisaeta distributa TaxID=164451 RepID=UPI0006CF4800|nr:hypothetical protein [Vulcanisaeta distributa]
MAVDRYSKERVHLIVITLVAGLVITYLLLRLIGILVALVTIALSVLIFTALQKSLEVPLVTFTVSFLRFRG